MVHHLLLVKFQIHFRLINDWEDKNRMFPDESLSIYWKLIIFWFFTPNTTPVTCQLFLSRLKIAAHETGIFLFVSSDLGWGLKNVFNEQIRYNLVFSSQMSFDWNQKSIKVKICLQFEYLCSYKLENFQTILLDYFSLLPS